MAPNLGEGQSGIKAIVTYSLNPRAAAPSSICIHDLIPGLFNVLIVSVYKLSRFKLRLIFYDN